MYFSDIAQLHVQQVPDNRLLSELPHICSCVFFHHYRQCLLSPLPHCNHAIVHRLSSVCCQQVQPLPTFVYSMYFLKISTRNTFALCHCTKHLHASVSSVHPTRSSMKFITCKDYKVHAFTHELCLHLTQLDLEENQLQVLGNTPYS